MRALKKLNRGVVITIIVVLCVSIYLIVLDSTQNTQKSAIQKVVESYVKTYVGYNMLPKDYRVENSNISKTELDSYISKMESDIKSYFTENDSAYKFMTNNLKSDLESQKSDTTVVYSYEKAISSYTDFSFDKSIVTVTFETNSKYDGPDKRDPTAGRLKLDAVTTDTVVLKKVKDDWKVVYSNINRPSQSNSLGGGIKIRHMIG